MRCRTHTVVIATPGTIPKCPIDPLCQLSVAPICFADLILPISYLIICSIITISISYSRAVLQRGQPKISWFGGQHVLLGGFYAHALCPPRCQVAGKVGSKDTPSHGLIETSTCLESSVRWKWLILCPLLNVVQQASVAASRERVLSFPRGFPFMNHLLTHFLAAGRV